MSNDLIKRSPSEAAAFLRGRKAAVEPRGDQSLASPANNAVSFLAERRGAAGAQSGEFRGTIKAVDVEGTSFAIFGFDATESRNQNRDGSWARMEELVEQTSILTENLRIKGVFFRGPDEFQATDWSTAPSLIRAMSAVTCETGLTQMERMLEFAVKERETTPIGAFIYCGDSCEELMRRDYMRGLGGRLAAAGTPIIIFNDIANSTNSEPGTDAFYEELATISKGAHVRLGDDPPEELAKALQAVFIYASKGEEALQNHARLPGTSRNVKLLTQRLTGRDLTI